MIYSCFIGLRLTSLTIGWDRQIHASLQLRLQPLYPLPANLFRQCLKFLHPAGEPFQLFLRDLVIHLVPGIDVGIFQQLEEALVLVGIERENRIENGFQAGCQLSEILDIVAPGLVRGQDEQGG